MEKKVDLRVQKTYDALTEAFEKLLKEKSFDEITVTELCSCARTRTATFYAHFKDKYDFCAFVIGRKRNHYTHQAEQVEFDSPKAYLESLIHAGFDFIEQNETLIFSLASGNMISTIAYTITKELNTDITKHFQHFQDCGYIFPAKPEIMTELFIGAMSQISRWWFENRKRVAKTEVINNVSRVLDSFITESRKQQQS